MFILGKKKYKNTDIEGLVKLAAQDDFEALEELVKRNQDSVYASFYYLSSDCQDIMDLTQEALLKMAKNIKKLKDPSKFKPWLNQIVTRIFYDHIRSKNRKLKTVPIDKKDDDEHDRFNVAEVPCKECTPEESSLNSELNCVIEKSIQKLPDSFKLKSLYCLDRRIYGNRERNCLQKGFFNAFFVYRRQSQYKRKNIY